jgi:Tfp pilus assembly protein PilW
MRKAARHRPRAGLSLAEAMVALAITSALLVAVAAAFSAASAAVNENDEFFHATQSARVTLNRILNDVRRGTVSNVFTAKGESLTYQ